jgi:hypothetical protein
LRGEGGGVELVFFLQAIKTKPVNVTTASAVNKKFDFVFMVSLFFVD